MYLGASQGALSGGSGGQQPPRKSDQNTWVFAYSGPCKAQNPINNRTLGRLARRPKYL